MYAIIRAGGKQAKVREGDVIDVERLHGEGEVTFTPVLFVDDKGTVISGREELRSARVTARVLGESAGDKVEMFKYKAKTGYRRRGGHRQKYTTLEVVKIEGPKKAAARKAVEGPDAGEPAPAATSARAAAKKMPAQGEEG
jgi:large subunit ribosomal protein L21